MLTDSIQTEGGEESSQSTEGRSIYINGIKMTHIFSKNGDMFNGEKNFENRSALGEVMGHSV